MLRSTRDSDDDVELKTGRTRSQRLNIHSTVNSPLRRSSRIKQSKCSPVSSESDTSVSNSQLIRNTRSRAATMDNTVSETLKGGRTRKPSISSDISESTDIDVIGTPKKRTTRSSLTAGSNGTPTKINTRATSKRLIRAGSETKSPPAIRSTRRTRASSVDPESLSEQGRSHPGTPVKTYKRIYVVPDSPVKEEDEKKNLIPYVRLDATIVETEEFTNSGNSDSSPDKSLHSQQSQRITNKKSQSIYKSEAEEDNIPESEERTLQLSEKKDEIHDKHMDKITVDDEIILVEKRKSEESSSNSSTTDEMFMQNNSNLSSSKEEDKLEIIKNTSGIEKTLKHSTTKELMIKIENFLNASEEKKGSSSNKENQTLNIINDKLESNIQPTNVTPLNSKCPSPIFADKSNEKETKSIKNESNLNKQYHSKESIESSIKHDSPCKKVDRIEEKMDISTDSLISDSTDKQKCLDSSSASDTTKRQSLILETDDKSITNDSNESILSQHEDIKLVDKTIVKDKASVKQISKSIENTIEDITKSDKIDEVESTIMDTDISKDSNKIELNKIAYSSKKQSKTEQESDNKKSLGSISIIDDNEMKLVLEEQSLYQDQSKSLSNISDFNSDQSIDLIVASSINKNSNNQSNVKEKQSIITQDNIINNTNFTKQEQKNPKNAIESVSESSNAALETINSTSNESNEDNVVIQDTQSSIVTKGSEKLPTIMSFKEIETKNTLKNIIKQDLTQKNTDNLYDHLEKEKEDLQLEEQKDTNTNIDSDVIFYDIPNDNLNKKEIEKEIDVETSSMHTNSQLLKELENESETECDLVLVDKKAWLAAENIKATKETESFEYDSDDTVLLKSRLDARTTYEQLPTINEDLSENRVDAKARSRGKKSLIAIEEKKMDYDNERINSFRRQEKYVLEKCKDSSSSCTEDESDNLIANVNKSIKEFETILNRSNRSVSKLNKSGQIVKATERSVEKDDESDEIEDDANKLNRSLGVKNKSLSKSMERRKSLNKSLTKNIPLRQGDEAMQNISLNKSQENYSTKELDNTAYLEKKIQKKKCSLNKSQNKDENISKSKEKNLSNVTKSPTHLNDDESDNSEIVIPVMNFTKNYSIIASRRLNSDEKTDSSDEDDSPIVPLEIHSNDADSNTDVNSLINSDIEKEYNLNGEEQKFSDDNVPGDECRASESETSDPDDNGSDLASFIVNDDEVIEEEEEDDDDNNKILHDDEEGEESDNEEEYKQNIEEAENVEKEEVDESIDEQSVKEENKVAKKKKIKNNEQDMKNMENKAEENIILDEEENFIKYIPSSTQMFPPEIKPNIKKNKSYTQKNENATIVYTSNLSTKKKRSDVQFSPQNVTEQNLITQSSKSEIIRKLPKSRKLECSTPKLDTCTQKFEFKGTPETVKRISGIKDTETDDTKTTQNSSLKKKKSKKDSISKENVSLSEFNPTSNEKKRLNKSLPSDLLEMIEKAGLSKPIHIDWNELCKTMNITHTESPTIRHLRKDKLNESAPTLNVKLDSGKKKLSFDKKVKDIVQTETKLKNDEEEIPNLVTPSNDDATQKRKKKQKKRKTQTEDISNENITDKALPQDMESNVPKQKKRKAQTEDISNENITDKVLSQDVESGALKKKKRIKLAQLQIVDDTCRDNQTDKKEKKRKKKQFSVIEQNENVNEENVFQKNIRKNKAESARHKRKKNEIVDSSELDLSEAIQKKSKRQKIAESEEIVPEKLLKKKKKKEEKTSSLQIEISKLKSDKNLASNKLQKQNIPSNIKSKNVFTKARDEALEAIHAAETRIRAKKELKEKKQENVENTIQRQILKIPDKKQRKKVAEKGDPLPSSTGRLKRLPDDVVKNLTDQPTKAKKKQKLSRTQQQIIPSVLSDKKSKVMTAKDNDLITVSSSGSTTQFNVVNLQKVKKQTSKSSSAAALFRQRIFARNNREPVSAYMMYLEKQKATSNNRFF